MEWDSCTLLVFLPSIYLSCHSFNYFLMSTVTQIHLKTHAHIGTHAAVLNATEPSPNVYVCPCVLCRGGRTEASRRRWTGERHMDHPPRQIMLAAKHLSLSKLLAVVQYFSSLKWNLLDTWTQNWRNFTIHPKVIISNSRNIHTHTLTDTSLKDNIHKATCMAVGS